MKDDQDDLKAVVLRGNSETTEMIQDELQQALPGLLDIEVLFHNDHQIDGTLLIGTPESSEEIAGLDLVNDLEGVGDEGYIIEKNAIDGNEVINCRQ